MFAYPDAARYRLGVNYQQLPPNAAHCPVYAPYQRDGAMVFGSNYGGDPNYVRSTQKPISFRKTAAITKDNPHDMWMGEVSDFSSEVTDEDFVQARALWGVLGRQEGQQENLVGNVAATLKLAKPDVRRDTICKLKTPV
jgi:catalase